MFQICTKFAMPVKSLYDATLVQTIADSTTVARLQEAKAFVRPLFRGKISLPQE